MGLSMKLCPWLHVAALTGVALVISTEALAASSGSQGQNTAGAGLFLAWAIAYLTSLDFHGPGLG